MSQVNTQHETQPGSQDCVLAQTLAPEEIRVGDWVAVLRVQYELPSYLWFIEATSLPIDEPVRITLRSPDVGKPYRVKSICLPFVAVKSRDGQSLVFDVRQSQLARLTKAYAKAAAPKPRCLKKNKKKKGK